jgi:DNA-binding PadR family transcriptional regulator
MSLQHMLLGLLDWKPLHGYALREWARNYGWLYPMTNANIYPTLRKLEQAGYVVHSEEIHSGRVRKVYEITEAGRNELQRWLADPDAPRLSVTDPVLLKLSLLRGEAIAAARPWLEKELAASRAEQAEMERHLERSGPSLSKYDRMVLTHGIRMARLRAEWLREALDELARDAAPGGAAA